MYIYIHIYSFLVYKMGLDSAYFIKLLSRLNEKLHFKTLELCPVHSKNYMSVAGTIVFYHHIISTILVQSILKFRGQQVMPLYLFFCQ